MRRGTFSDGYRKSSNPGVLISNLGKDGGHLIEEGRLFNFSQIMAWHDHFFNTSSAHKQQHKLFIDIKS